MKEFLWGALAMSGGVAGLFFLRFWRVGRERLFLFLAIAFWAMSFNWLALALIDPAQESRHYIFLLRLFAFLLIIAGILDKNRRGRNQKPGIYS